MNNDNGNNPNKPSNPINPTNRRKILKTGAAATALLGFPFINTKFASADAGRPLKIGYVIPKTGPLGNFAESDRFVLGELAAVFKKGLMIGNKLHPVQIIEKDSQSTSNRAGEVASDLILKDKVDLMLAGAAPETVNPVADQCELNEMPCVTTICPWQPWFFTRGGDPATGFNWTYHYFWGLEDIIAVFTNMWDSLPTNKQVGALFPNDGDGNAWGDPERGFPKPLKAKGYTLHDPGRYQNLQQDFSAQIAAFKKANCEVVTGVMIPPDFKTFWTQAAQQGFKPKAVSVGKALGLPLNLEAIGDIADGLSTEVFWSPAFPFKSALTGLTCKELGANYEKSTGRQWTQMLGFTYSLFEIGIDVLKRSKNIDDKAAIRDAIVSTNLNTMVGPISWDKGPVRNVAKVPLVGGQWVKGKSRKFELVVVNNKTAPQIPVGAEMKLIGS
ncbi:MAG: ABC transporter substrate-binding protein [Pseudomonadota bacterium]|nr:ABC transporter substrate-binding protein [Pseudomonadota bacterium]